MFDKEYYTIPRLPIKVKAWLIYVSSILGFWFIFFSILTRLIGITGWILITWWIVLLVISVPLASVLLKYLQEKYNTNLYGRDK